MKWPLVVSFFIATSVTAQNKIDFSKAPDTVALVPARFINSANSERDFALSPDGKEIFYTVQTLKGSFQTLFYSKRKPNGEWSQPVIAPFAGNYSDLEPAFSVDGKKLFFSSNRPVTGKVVKDFDIWVVEKTSTGWGNPVNLGPVVNTVHDEFYPSITSKGDVYFTAAYEGGMGKEDVYVSRWRNGSYQQPELLDAAINSKMYEFNAFVTPDEEYLFFTSYGRSDDKGGGDLYISKKGTDNKWLPAKHLDMLSSNKLDYCPFVSFDKKTLFFTSEKSALQTSYPDKPITTSEFQQLLSSWMNGGGNIYWIKLSSVVRVFK